MRRHPFPLPFLTPHSSLSIMILGPHAKAGITPSPKNQPLRTPPPLSNPYCKKRYYLGIIFYSFIKCYWQNVSTSVKVITIKKKIVNKRYIFSEDGLALPRPHWTQQQQHNFVVLSSQRSLQVQISRTRFSLQITFGTVIFIIILLCVVKS